VNLKKSRIGILLAPTTPVWQGTVTAYVKASFILGFTTTYGSLSNVKEGYHVVCGRGEDVRIRTVGSVQFKLAENPVDYQPGDVLSVYPARVPFPRYQFIDEDGVTHKDYDIDWPGANAAMPPMCWLWTKPADGERSEAIWGAVGQEFAVTGDACLAMVPSGGDPLSYAWDAGSGGAIMGSGVDVTIKWSTPGFRYLKLTVTDALGTSSVRYMPVWIGIEPYKGVERCSARWSTTRGWTVDVTFSMPDSFLQHTPAAIVDLDTGRVLFFGFVFPSSISYDFEAVTTSMTIEGALSYAQHLYSYPFILTTVTTPDQWEECTSLSLERALWFMLYWHSTLSEVANVGPGTAPGARAIQEQTFAAGTIATQIDKLAGAAFRVVRGYRSGGFRMAENILYQAETVFDACPYNADLSSRDSLVDQVEVESPKPSVGEIQLSGAYKSGSSWAVLIVKAPEHPMAHGGPSEMTELAPLNQAELELWAGRHIAVEDLAKRYTVTTVVDVDPAVDYVADLPGFIRIAVEDVTLEMNEGTWWGCRVSGRERGESAGVVVVPPPPNVVIPEPTIPDVIPPLWPPLPPVIYEWPTQVYVATKKAGVFYAADFSGPDDISQPTWVAVNDGLPDLRCQAFYCDPVNPAGYQYLHGYDAAGDSCMYRRLGTGSWSSILTKAQAGTLTSMSFPNWYSLYLTQNRSVAGRLECIVFSGYEGHKLIRSTDYGTSWSLVGNVTGGSNAYNNYYPFVAIGDVLYILNRWPLYGDVVLRSLDGGTTWSRSTVNVGGLAGRAVSAALTSAVYSKNGSTGIDMQLVGFDGAAHTAIQDSLNFFSDPGYLWLSDVAANWQRIVCNSKLYETADSWTGVSLLATLDRTYSELQMLYPDDADREDWMVLGMAGTGKVTASYPHSIFVLDLAEGATTTGKAGTSPGVSPYTGSIPYTGEGICHNGIQIVG